MSRYKGKRVRIRDFYAKVHFRIDGDERENYFSYKMVDPKFKFGRQKWK